MFKRLVLIVALCLSTLSLSAQVERLEEYRGWKDCYSLKNATTELIVCPEAGGRVLYYAIDGENIIYVDRSFDGYLKADMQRTRKWADGGRFDIGPEALPGKMREDIFLGEWSAQVVGKREVLLTFDKPNAMGLKVTRSFKLARKGSALNIVQTMTNISDENVSRHYWGRVFCKGGGLVEMPLDSDEGWGGMAIHGYGASKVVGDRLMTQLDGTTIKVGSDSQEGWITYSVDGLKIHQTFKCYKGANYSDTENFTTVFYSNKDVCEVEPVGPTIDLAPGESSTFKQKWVLTHIED